MKRSVLYYSFLVIFFGMAQSIALKNVLGTELKLCCSSPVTGYFRDGFCRTNQSDHGRHVVCAKLTDKFLNYTKRQGNDLSTPRPQFNFPGLKAGDKWCLCALRWKEAFEAGFAPPLILESTHEKALEYISKDILLENTCKITNQA